MGVALTHFAGRVGDPNDRAMAASPRLAAALAERFGMAPTVIGTPRPALSTTWDAELDAARGELTQMQNHYQGIFLRGEIPVAATSRCPVAFATLPTVVQHHPNAVVLWIDAQPDLHTPTTTTSGRLGGLALSGPLGLWDSGLGNGLVPESCILAGIRDIDPPEVGVIEDLNLTVVPPGTNFGQRLDDAVAGRPVYIHLDCDALWPDKVATDSYVDGCIPLSDVADAAAALSSNEIVGIEIAELEAITGDEDLTPLLDALHLIFQEIL